MSSPRSSVSLAGRVLEASLRRRRASCGPEPPRQLFVGDVTGERVDEGELTLTLHRGLADAADQLVLKQAGQRVRPAPARSTVSHGRERPFPEHAADRRRRRRGAPSGHRGRVSRRAAMTAWTESGSGRLEAGVGQEPRRLLGVEGVALAALNDFRRPPSPASAGLIEQTGHQSAPSRRARAGRG